MNLPRTILFPTDFSESADQALDYAVEFAGKLDAKLHLLHVLVLLPLGPELTMAMTSGKIDELMKSSQQALDRLVAERAGKAGFGPTLLKTGDPRTLIDATAAELGADLIIMGTRGRRGVVRLLLGSVAESVARTAPCPVLLVRGERKS
ncbi:MAG TPA: universal stress protein [Kofleriaceae bacterium]|nr:universal stress protein [Kofleriaceae bacterium]